MVLESKEKESGGSSSNADTYSSHLFCHSQKVSYGNLTDLTIDRNPFCVHEIPASSYQLLEELRIWGYKGSRSLLSSSIAKNLVHLKRLSIRGCGETEQVIKDDDEEERVANSNLFPKLEELRLTSLPKLVSFCELKCDLVLPSLRTVGIFRCPGMKNWNLGFLAAPNLEEISTDLDHHLELGVNVSFDRLKRLFIGEVGNVEYPFYHHNSFASFLDGLEELHLSRLGSMSSFPYSVAGKLVNLRFLIIRGCDEMVKVIEEEEEEEDEVVVSGCTSTLLFPKLEYLELMGLLKLESFCERKCGVELPSLRTVSIYSCPRMKSFSMGPLSSPNLESIRINNDKYTTPSVPLHLAGSIILYPTSIHSIGQMELNVGSIGDGKDLNRTVQQHYLITQQKEEEEEERERKRNRNRRIRKWKKTKKNEKKEGGEDEQKSKDDEIQDHCSQPVKDEEGSNGGVCMQKEEVEEGSSRKKMKLKK